MEEALSFSSRLLCLCLPPLVVQHIFYLFLSLSSLCAAGKAVLCKLTKEGLGGGAIEDDSKQSESCIISTKIPFMCSRTENINATFAKVRAEYGCVVQSTEVKHAKIQYACDKNI
jgi:hypothetical protein